MVQVGGFAGRTAVLTVCTHCHNSLFAVIWRGKFRFCPKSRAWIDFGLIFQILCFQQFRKMSGVWGLERRVGVQEF